MSDIDAAILITLVQARPVLWDEFLDIYKDGDATNNAWHEVCVELHSAFDVLDNKDKILFRKCILVNIIISVCIPNTFILFKIQIM